MHLDAFFQALALFVPILAANQGGSLARWVDAPLARMPVSIRWFGPNKTVATYYVGPAAAGFVLWLYRDPNWFAESWVLGLGAVLGDHIKSFIKRRLDIPPGAPWFFDRVDFAIGGGLAAYGYFPWVTLEHVLYIVALAYPIHLFGNRVSHRLGLRDTPH